MRVFDFAMTISDLNNLVHLTAQSKDSKGRAYSAGVTNAGVYERQEAFRREGQSQRELLKVRTTRCIQARLLLAFNNSGVVLTCVTPYCIPG
jgi:hypothetical protein